MGICVDRLKVEGVLFWGVGWGGGGLEKINDSTKNGTETLFL